MFNPPDALLLFVATSLRSAANAAIFAISEGGVVAITTAAFAAFGVVMASMASGWWSYKAMRSSSEAKKQLEPNGGTTVRDMLDQLNARQLLTERNVVNVQDGQALHSQLLRGLSESHDRTNANMADLNATVAQLASTVAVLVEELQNDKSNN